MFAMGIREVRITLISNRNERREFSGDERRCCIQAEDVLRQWFWTGCTIEIISSDAASRMRMQSYLGDVSRELSHEARATS